VVATSITPVVEMIVCSNRTSGFRAASPTDPLQCSLGENLPAGGVMEQKTSPCPNNTRLRTWIKIFPSYLPQPAEDKMLVPSES